MSRSVSQSEHCKYYRFKWNGDYIVSCLQYVSSPLFDFDRKLPLSIHFVVLRWLVTRWHAVIIINKHTAPSSNSSLIMRGYFTSHAVPDCDWSNQPTFHGTRLPVHPFAFWRSLYSGYASLASIRESITCGDRPSLSTDSTLFRARKGRRLVSLAKQNSRATKLRGCRLPNNADN